MASKYVTITGQVLLPDHDTEARQQLEAEVHAEESAEDAQEILATDDGLATWVAYRIMVENQNADLAGEDFAIVVTPCKPTLTLTLTTE